MVSAELREVVVGLTPARNLVFVLRDQNGPGVSAVGTQDHVVIEEARHARGST